MRKIRGGRGILEVGVVDAVFSQTAFLSVASLPGVLSAVCKEGTRAPHLT